MTKNPLNETTLISGLQRRMVWVYVTPQREQTRRDVLLLKITERDNQDGTHRIFLHAREIDDPSGVSKTFSLHRIVGVVDQNTGEIIDDVETFFTRFLDEQGGIQPAKWPDRKAERIRTKNLMIEFDGDGNARDWRFGVGREFQSAMDIVFTNESRMVVTPDGKGKVQGTRKVWTKGLPPLLAFDTGDTFFSPPLLNDDEWVDQLLYLEQSITVLSSEHDRLVQGRLMDGKVRFLLRNYEAGQQKDDQEMELTQQEFLEILQNGISKFSEKMASIKES